MSGCLFCKIAAGDQKAKIVHSDDDVVAFEDIAPQAPTHILVVPRLHVETITDLKDKGVLSLLPKIYSVIADIVKKHGLGNKGYRVVVNQGSDAGQAVSHIHFHLLSGRKFTWPPG
jgi:histidine triad (HIT) family protein